MIGKSLSFHEMAYEIDEAKDPNRYHILLRREYGGDFFYDPINMKYVAGDDLKFFLDYIDDEEGDVFESRTTNEMLYLVYERIAFLTSRTGITYTTPSSFIENIMTIKMASLMSGNENNKEKIDEMLKRMSNIPKKPIY